MSLKNHIIIPALVFTLLSETVSHVYRGDTCKTQEGVNGVCRPIQECPVAIKELGARRRPTSCGFEGFIPIVCCIEYPRGTMTRQPNHAAITPGVAAEDDEMPEKTSEKASEDFLGTTTPEPKRANIIYLVTTVKDKPDDSSEKSSKIPSWTTTPEPKFPAIIPKVISEEARKVEDPVEKSGKDTVEGGSEVLSKRIPGEAATFWCEHFVEKCESPQEWAHELATRPPRRFKRAIEENKIPDYEEFGTSERTPRQRHFGINFNGPSIVGGEESFMNEFPHMAAVGFGKQSEIRWECGGSLISDTFVLTAAHCLIARDGSRAEWVLLGSQYISDQLRGYSVSTNGVIYNVIRRIRHPDYKRSSKYNDLALLELGPSLNYDKRDHGMIHPACLQVEWNSIITRATATGWGRLDHGGSPSSSLQKVAINILDNSVCNETYSVEMKLSKLVNGIDESMICAGELDGGKDTCQGDSGGPLQLRTNSCLTHVIGVTSFGKVCGFPDSPAVYMRISHFIPWIESIVWPE